MRDNREIHIIEKKFHPNVLYKSISIGDAEFVDSMKYEIPESSWLGISKSFEQKLRFTFDNRVIQIMIDWSTI